MRPVLRGAMRLGPWPAAVVGLAAALALAAVLGLDIARPALAADPTSCDIKTGASCLWNEGCDCDHDGYVRDSGKAQKYCHFDKCPLDSNDTDATKLGKTSTNNADGDGWTKAYDCDDNDKCIGKTCGVSVCPGAPDAGPTDSGATPDAGTGVDVPPQSDVAETDIAKPDSTNDVAPADAQPADILVKDVDTAEPPDVAAPQDQQSRLPDAEQTTQLPDIASLLADSGGTESVVADADIVGGGGLQDSFALVGGGVVLHGEPPAPGCGASPAATGTVAGLVALLSLSLLALGRRRLLRAMLLLTVLCGCATVQPWQRERLAHRCMILGRNAGEQTLEQHTFQYREGAAGGFGGGGGGCGCN